MSEDFTEQRYAEILDLARSRFSFHPISQIPDSDGVALWRHDIDFSPQRALAMATMEAKRGVVATYYVQLSSCFYSLFDQQVAAILREISAMGHEIGVHFDPSVYPEGNLISRLSVEKALIGDLTSSDVTSFSLHNPTTYDASLFTKSTVAGMVNASTAELRERFTYCSDSNGMWRFTPLIEVLEDPNVNSVYILTHPVWWTADAIMPRDKVKRSLDGRAAAELRNYDALLEANQRKNIGK